MVGAYQGSHCEGNKTVGDQTVNPDQAKAIESNDGTKAGTVVLHEVLESYTAMNIGLVFMQPARREEGKPQLKNKPMPR